MTATRFGATTLLIPDETVSVGTNFLVDCPSGSSFWYSFCLKGEVTSIHIIQIDVITIPSVYQS